MPSGKGQLYRILSKLHLCSFENRPLQGSIMICLFKKKIKNTEKKISEFDKLSGGFEPTENLSTPATFSFLYF